MARPRTTTPVADEIRCPTCRAVDWRRLGERIIAGPGEKAGAMVATHLLVNEHGPLDWTCERCGYHVKAASTLDHRLARVQVPVILGGAGTTGLGGVGGFLAAAWNRLTQAVSPAPATIVSAVAVVVVVGSAWYLAAPRPVTPSAPSSSLPVAAVAATPALITDLELVANASDAELVGRPVELGNAPVESVTGDVTFWLGPSERERVFVVLDERSQGEAAVTVRPGQRLRVHGSVARAPVGRDDLSSADRTALQHKPIYLAIDWVVVVANRP